MKNEPLWIGVDFGAKLAGTTAVCYKENDTIVFTQSATKQDADRFLSGFLQKINPTHVFIDAPLTLPGKYTGKGDDYFFRQGDKDVGAMSPMFLGGLTARAIKIKDCFPDIRFFESYPSHLAKKVLKYELPTYKKEQTPEISSALLKKISDTLITAIPANYHQLDAFLCWLTGRRYFSGEALHFGNEQEGLIWV